MSELILLLVKLIHLRVKGTVKSSVFQSRRSRHVRGTPDFHPAQCQCRTQHTAQVIDSGNYQELASIFVRAILLISRRGIHSNMMSVSTRENARYDPVRIVFLSWWPPCKRSAWCTAEENRGSDLPSVVHIQLL
eukprot:376721-Rhodomonas_salina.1